MKKITHRNLLYISTFSHLGFTFVNWFLFVNNILADDDIWLWRTPTRINNNWRHVSFFLCFWSLISISLVIVVFLRLCTQCQAYIRPSAWHLEHLTWCKNNIEAHSRVSSDYRNGGCSSWNNGRISLYHSLCKGVFWRRRFFKSIMAIRNAWLGLSSPTESTKSTDCNFLKRIW